MVLNKNLNQILSFFLGGGCFQEREILSLSAEIQSLKNPQNLNLSPRLDELREENAKLKYRLNILKRVSEGERRCWWKYPQGLRTLKGIFLYSEGNLITLVSVFPLRRAACVLLSGFIFLTFISFSFSSVFNFI